MPPPPPAAQYLLKEFYFIFYNYFILYGQVEFFLSLQADIEDDILPFWKKHDGQFPYLRTVARKTLSICATSVASERLFSLSGHIVSRKRNALKPQMVNMLVFLAYNGRQ